MTSRTCHCGCDKFRFRPVDPDNFDYMRNCNNCGHSLADHINIVRSKQSE